MPNVDDNKRNTFVNDGKHIVSDYKLKSSKHYTFSESMLSMTSDNHGSDSKNTEEQSPVRLIPLAKPNRLKVYKNRNDDQ